MDENGCASWPTRTIILTCSFCLLALYFVLASRVEGVLGWGAASDEQLQDILDEEDNVKTRIIFAREELKVQN